MTGPGGPSLAEPGRAGTVTVMATEVHTDNDVRRRLLRSKLVLSFLDQARPGDIHDPDPERRVAAWANWAVGSLVEVNNGERAYAALRLPGAFYDPRGQGPKIVPHLEIPKRMLGSGDPLFPTRLAQAGNALVFPYWLYQEVTAVRRAVLHHSGGDIGPFVELLDSKRSALVTALETLALQAAPRWATISGRILSADDGLADDATGDFSAGDLTSFIPSTGPFAASVHYDPQLLERAAGSAARRIGVWTIAGTVNGAPFHLGVATPRLTVNSLFHDPLFEPAHESSAALLVRLLLLRRLTRRHLGTSAGSLPPDVPARRGGEHLRAVPARPGQKLPAASVSAAMNFLAAHPDPDAAWQALHRWADKGYLLTVTRDGFTGAHRSASQALRRVEEPERADIDCILPLAWDVRDGKSQVVRVTFSSPGEE